MINMLSELQIKHITEIMHTKELGKIIEMQLITNVMYPIGLLDNYLLLLCFSFDH